MKHAARPHILFCACTLAGLPAMGLRMWYLSAGLDEKGLLQTMHPAQLLLWILTGAVLLFLFLNLPAAVKEASAIQKHPLLLRAAGCLIWTAGLGITGAQLLGSSVIVAVFCLLAAVSAFVCALCFCKALRPHFLLYVPSVLAMMLYLINRYRCFSAIAESQRYLFQLLAVVGGALCSYYRVSGEARQGHFVLYLVLRCLTPYCALAALPGSDHPWLLLALALWLLLDPSTLAPKPKEEAA